MFKNEVQCKDLEECVCEVPDYGATASQMLFVFDFIVYSVVALRQDNTIQTCSNHTQQTQIKREQSSLFFQTSK